MITLEKSHSVEEEIKKSRFIATAIRVNTIETAVEQIGRLSQAAASHNCWAYKIGDQYRFSDDGEPGGTAGRPILAAIEGQGVDCVLALVTRFFGGIKLGAGGLVRAYGGTAAKCLRDAPKREVRPTVEISIKVPFEAIGSVYPVLSRFDAIKLGETYREDGIEITLKIETRAAPEFKSTLTNATKGAVAFKKESR
jgi:uncharacterized YigZ family protein